MKKNKKTWKQIFNKLLEKDVERICGEIVCDPKYPKKALKVLNKMIKHYCKKNRMEIIDFIEKEIEEAQKEADLARVALLAYEFLPVLKEIKKDYE